MILMLQAAGVSLCTDFFFLKILVINNICIFLGYFCVFFLQNVVGVTIGGTLGHALCTGLAVIGGRLIAQRISVRTGT